MNATSQRRATNRYRKKNATFLQTRIYFEYRLAKVTKQKRPLLIEWYSAILKDLNTIHEASKLMPLSKRFYIQDILINLYMQTLKERLHESK